MRFYSIIYKTCNHSKKWYGKNIRKHYHCKITSRSFCDNINIWDMYNYIKSVLYMSSMWIIGLFRYCDILSISVAKGPSFFKAISTCNPAYIQKRNSSQLDIGRLSKEACALFSSTFFPQVPKYMCIYMYSYRIRGSDEEEVGEMSKKSIAGPQVAVYCTWRLLWGFEVPRLHKSDAPLQRMEFQQLHILFFQW